MDYRSAVYDYPKPLLLALPDPTRSVVPPDEREELRRLGGPNVQFACSTARAIRCIVKPSTASPRTRGLLERVIRVKKLRGGRASATASPYLFSIVHTRDDDARLRALRAYRIWILRRGRV